MLARITNPGREIPNMFEHIEKDVGRAMYASMVRGIILYHTQHLKLLVTYGEIAAALSTLPNGGQIGQALALITVDDFKHKRPLSTAVVVNSQTKRPGKGFFDQCQELGIKFSSPEDFWQSQIKKLGVAEFYLSELDKIESRPDTELDSFGRAVVGKVSEHKAEREAKKFKTRAVSGPDDVSEGIGHKLAALLEAATVEPSMPHVDPLPSPVRMNGGVVCDVEEGPCACKAWHHKETPETPTASGLPT